ncbi:putative ErfK/YbiS/YcfS/YnhG family protein [Streptomyces viridochromogenes Tue57]|uniref:Putative ErfK/YbiS/YcfS/YnhG family protein n=1 Tax=Streptomyces viridochromogenes Tue57 TaxID=1160705 RepID=L8P434_STRVR|nr:putative ErfK/YbiS/YcfS/YnhG family protein [Streptomyces viridochromogenes Tue57]
MNSETAGGDTCDKMVDHSMRLTWSGMYARATPWHTRRVGKANHSSRGTGTGDADAAWFQEQARPGDPFALTGQDSKGVVAPGNRETR